ncbi:MAG: hypothetical protein WCC95_02885 [Candidatus Sulfotelmatobacter sp.]|jgi:hypothetical protein
MDPALLAVLVALVAMIGWSVYRVSRRGVSAAVIRDWSIYAVVGFLIVVGICLSAGAKINASILTAWVTPIVTAGFVFGFPARTYWPYARRATFWATLFPPVLLHFLFFLIILPPAWRGNPLLVVIIGLPEMFMMYVALILVLGRPPRPPG